MNIRDGVLIIILFTGMFLAFTTFAVMQFAKEQTELGEVMAPSAEQPSSEGEAVGQNEPETRLGGALDRAKRTKEGLEERDRGMDI